MYFFYQNSTNNNQQSNSPIEIVIEEKIKVGESSGSKK